MSENQETQSTVSPETIAKIVAWGRENFPEWVENIKLITALYNDKHTALTVSDCIAGAKAKLTLLFVRAYEPNTYKVCGKCNRAKCSEKCGEQAFEDKTGHAFLAGDKSGIIMVKTSHFTKGELPTTERVYTVEGTIQEYNGKLSINSSNISPAGVQSASKPIEVKNVEESKPPADEQVVGNAVLSIANIIRIFDGAIEENKLFELLAKQGYGKEVASTAIQVGITKGTIKGTAVGENKVAYTL